jgi:hypothetical protein
VDGVDFRSYSEPIASLIVEVHKLIAESQLGEERPGAFN